jgi:hypothetical protein
MSFIGRAALEERKLRGKPREHAARLSHRLAGN